MSIRYQAPAGIDDAARGADPDVLRNAWHKVVSDYIAGAKRTQTGFFYDQLADALTIPDSAPSLIPWAAYPKWVTTAFDGFAGPFDEAAADAFAETLESARLYTKTPAAKFKLAPWSTRLQDEYCEWSIVRQGNDIVAMQFTAEPPEYWDTLFSEDPQLVVTLYRELLKTNEVQENDLRFTEDHYRSQNSVLKKAAYNWYNKWNVGPNGLIHLTQRANTLGAEIKLASEGTVDWTSAGAAPTEQSLICCAQFGDAARHSDPRIGWTVNDLVSNSGACAALADPIGLYMTPFDLDDLLDPNGHPIGHAALSFPRKSADGSRILRAEVRVPAGATYGLQNCTLGGHKLQFGGQIARRITMGLYAVAKIIPGHVRDQSACQGFCCPHPQSPKLVQGISFDQAPDCAHVPPDAYRALPPNPHAGIAPSGAPSHGLPSTLDTLDIRSTPSQPSRARN